MVWLILFVFWWLSMGVAFHTGVYGVCKAAEEEYLDFNSRIGSHRDCLWFQLLLAPVLMVGAVIYNYKKS